MMATAELGADAPLQVAYLVNHYPKVSHSFIRREILALERLGHKVQRIAVRGWDDVLVDAADQAERVQTRYLLQQGIASLLPSFLGLALARPAQMTAAVRLAVSRWRRSDRTIFHHLAYLIEACAVVRLLAASRATHLHAHFGTNPADVAMLVRVLGGPPYSFTVHGPEEFDKPQTLGLDEKGGRAAFVVAISSFGRSQLYRWLAQPHWDKVDVVHCGLEPAFHRPVPGSEMLPDASRLVCVGRLCEQKGQLLLVRAVARLVAKGRSLELVLAGDGEMRAEIESLIDRFGLTRSIRITGWISSGQVREEILAARALVLPSFAEGLPVVLIEAMALRRPVISTYIAGIPELVIDGENGWLVAAGDLDGLEQAIERCLDAAPDVIGRMGDAGQARALERHDIDREAAKLADLFASAAADAPIALQARSAR